MQQPSKIFIEKRLKGKKLVQVGSTCHLIVNPDMGSKNLIVGYLVLEAKSRTKPNIHPNSEEAFYITKGKGIIKVNNEARNVEKGDVIFIPKNVWHEFENTEDEPMEWVLIISPPPSEEEYKSSPWKIEE